MSDELTTGVSTPEVQTTPATVEQPARKTPLKSTPELREYNRVAAQQSRQRKAERNKVEGLKYTSKIEVTKADALELLAQRITNPHVREVAYEAALQCAAATGVTANRFFFAHGYQKLIESQEAGTEKFLEADPKEVIPTEIIHAGDAYSIWDYSVFWREPDVTFDQFITKRTQLKSDWYALGEFMGKGGPLGLCEQPHREWQRFLPSFVPDLRPGYSQTDMLQWLAKQKSPSYPETNRDFLLMASRNSLKSSVGLLFLTTAVLACPSLRILLVSETTKLSRLLTKAFRAIWETPSADPSLMRFHRWFPEYVIEQGSGSVLEFESPMKHLPLPQATASAASLEMAMAGGRFELGWFDDPISNMNTGMDTGTQDVMCPKGIAVYDALLKLREAGGASIVCTIGTAWTPGDLYQELQRRNEADPDKSLAMLIQPAWIVKPEARHKHILQLTEEDIESLAYPTRLTFKSLMKEARANLSLFRSQNLLEYFEDDDQVTMQFTREACYAAVRISNPHPEAQRLLRVQSWDSAFSAARTADFSCGITADLMRFQDKDYIFVIDVQLTRQKTSDLGVLIAETMNRLNPDKVIAERTGDYVSLNDAILRAGNIRGYVLPQVFWQPVSSVLGISGSLKAARAKGMEPLLADGRLLFSAGIPNLEGCFKQLIRFDGRKKSGSSDGSKDDFVDALALLVSTWGPRGYTEPELTEAQIEFERQEENQRLLKAQKEWIFGNPQQPQQVYMPPPPDTPDSWGLTGTLRRFGLLRR